MKVLPDDAGDGTGTHEAHDDETFSFHRQRRAEEEEAGNVQRSTSNVQPRTKKNGRTGLSEVKRWMLNVGRWAFLKIEALTMWRRTF
jgi:hypothetical protein